MNNDDGYNSSGKDVRKGKWTPEEENYSNKIISMFNQGLLYIPAGTTLRSYLSEKLSCDPMRITKKFAGASCIGKQVFHPCEHSEANNQLRKEGLAELQQLEIAFLNRLRTKSSAIAQLVDKLTPTQSPGGGRGVKNKHNPIYSSSVDKNSYSSLDHLADKNRNNSDAGYTVVKDESVGDSESNLFQKNKRIVSATDLTLLMDSKPVTDVAYSPSGQFLLGSTPKKSVAKTRVRTGSGAKLVRENSDNIGLQQHHNSLARGKKYHSSMDLANYEKLATDDKAAGDLFLQFVQQLGDKYVTPTNTQPLVPTTVTHGPSNLTSRSASVDQLNLLSQASQHHSTSHTSTTHTTTGGMFMTIDDVISATVAQDFSSFSVSEKIPSPFNNSGTNGSRSMSVLSNQSPLLLSNPDLVSLNPILVANKEGLALSHTSVQGIEHLDRATLLKNTNNGVNVAEPAPIFVDQSHTNMEVFEENKDMGDIFF